MPFDFKNLNNPNPAGTVQPTNNQPTATPKFNFKNPSAGITPTNTTTPQIDFSKHPQSFVDGIKHIASGVGKVMDIGSNVLGDVARAPIRATMAPALDVAAGATSLATGKDVKAEYQAKTPIQKAVFGEKPVEGLLEQEKPFKNPMDVLAQPAMVAGKEALDLTFPGAAKAGEEAIADVGSKIAESQASKEIPKLAEFTAEKMTPAAKEIAYREGRLSEATATKAEKFIADKSDLFRGQVAKDIGLTKGSFSKNIERTKEALKTEAENLKTIVGDKKILVSPSKVSNILNKMKSDATTDLTNEETKVYDKMVNKFGQIMNNKSGDLQGLLDSRKEFDSWAKSNNPKIFENATGGAYRALKSTRDAINQYIDKEVGDNIVKGSLKKQSAMFDILDNLSEKAGRGVAKLKGSKIGEAIKKNIGKYATAGAVVEGGKRIITGKF